MQSEVSYEELATLITLNYARHLEEPYDDPELPHEAKWHRYTNYDYYHEYPCKILHSIGVLKEVREETYVLATDVELGRPIKFQITENSAPYECMVEMLAFVRFMHRDLLDRGLLCYDLDVPQLAVRFAMQASVFEPPYQIRGLRLGRNGWADIHSIQELNTNGAEIYSDWMEYSAISALMRLGLASMQSHGSLRLNIERKEGSTYGVIDKCRAFLKQHPEW